MFKVLILLIASAAVGYILRRNSRLQKLLSRSTPITIFILLFMFGLSIGSNETLLSIIHKEGAKAGAIALLGVAGINSMDVCLPMIVGSGKSSDPQLVSAALFHGIILEISVPVLISIFCS